MTKIISLTLYPWGYPIAFETTGIKVVGTSQDSDDRAVVNDMAVKESYNAVVFMLRDKY